MRFVYYTDKTVAQSMAAITERLHAKTSKGVIDGWADKNGRFSISITAPVVGKLTRHTVLTGRAERENGVTVVRGNVPSGVAPNERRIAYALLAVGALFSIASGNILFTVLLIPATALLYITMHGDYENHQQLVGDVRRILKATEKPPKSLAAKSGSARATGTTRAVSSTTRATTPRATTPRTTNMSGSARTANSPRSTPSKG